MNGAIEIGKRVLTVNGEGVIVGCDLPESHLARAIVELDRNPFDFTPAYFPDEFCEIDTSFDKWPEKVAVGVATINVAPIFCNRSRKPTASQQIRT